MKFRYFCKCVLKSNTNENLLKFCADLRSSLSCYVCKERCWKFLKTDIVKEKIYLYACLFPLKEVGKDVLPFESAPSFEQSISEEIKRIGKHISFHFNPMLTLREAPENFGKSNQNNRISKFLL